MTLQDAPFLKKHEEKKAERNLQNNVTPGIEEIYKDVGTKTFFLTAHKLLHKKKESYCRKRLVRIKLC